ncbi:MAG: hypothetical protein J6K32_00810 [Clostridia bacterium]|nr:hypothetical protein [Clostridia bacterium]
MEVKRLLQHKEWKVLPEVMRAEKAEKNLYSKKKKQTTETAWRAVP